MTTERCLGCLVVAVVGLIFSCSLLMAEDNGANRESGAGLIAWQEEAVKRARLMSRVKWTPVADGMPIRGKGCFKKGVEYTGVPYSSVKYKGRYIGFDIYLKTFLAAVQNPCSVVYTENLSGEVKNAACYYGTVCSSFTSYGLGCGIWYRSLHHTPPYREGIVLVEPPSAEAAKVGDIIYTPPKYGSHVEFVTGITRDEDGRVTHVRVEDSWPPTSRNINRSADNFSSHVGSRDRKVYRTQGSTFVTALLHLPAAGSCQVSWFCGSGNRCQSAQERERREASSASTAPTRCMETSATSSLKSSRLFMCVPLSPRSPSSTFTWLDGHPISTALSRRADCLLSAISKGGRMANRRLSMRKLREILRLKHEVGLKPRQIARSCGISPTTLYDYLERLGDRGIAWPLPDDWPTHSPLAISSPWDYPCFM